VFVTPKIKIVFFGFLWRYGNLLNFFFFFDISKAKFINFPIIIDTVDENLNIFSVLKVCDAHTKKKNYKINKKTHIIVKSKNS